LYSALTEAELALHVQDRARASPAACLAPAR